MYSKAGRYEAAIKALTRAQELDSQDWIASYFLGDVYRQTGQYTAAIEIFSTILLKEPSEIKVLLSLAKTHFDLGRSELASFFTARAEGSLVACLKASMQLLETSSGYRRIVWKVAADAVYQLSQLSAFADADEIISTARQLSSLLTEQPEERIRDLISSPHDLDSSSVAGLALALLDIAILSYSYYASFGAVDDNASGSACYDLGVALLSYAQRTTEISKQDRSRHEAVTFLKEALALDPGNDRYWSTLGTALFVSQPKTSQHAYIRSLEIDPRVSIFRGALLHPLHH